MNVTDVTKHLQADWRTVLEAPVLDDTEIMLAVALQLGWRVEEYSGADEDTGKMHVYYRAINPQGEVTEAGMSHMGALDNKYWLWSGLPHYTRRLGEAWKLIPDMSTGIYFYLSNTGTPARCRAVNALNNEHLADELARKPQIAIIKAWLAWQESQATLTAAESEASQ